VRGQPATKKTTHISSKGGKRCSIPTQLLTTGNPDLSMSGRNQIKDIFQGVTVQCPLEITQYGQCLVLSKEKDSLGYHSCNQEFLRLLKCFQKVHLFSSRIASADLSSSRYEVQRNRNNMSHVYGFNSMVPMADLTNHSFSSLSHSSSLPLMQAPRLTSLPIQSGNDEYGARCLCYTIYSQPRAVAAAACAEHHTHPGQSLSF
jgi:hypothetical protein